MKNISRTEAFQKWLDYFKNFCIHNDDIAETLFYQICGIKLRNAKIQYAGQPISLVIHQFIIQPSGSGKGQSIKPLIKICEKINISHIVLTHTTDAGLEGTIRPLNPKEKKQDENSDETTKIIYGVLKDKDIVVFNEGEALLQTGKDFNKDVYQILQNATDTQGMVSKKLALGEIEYKTNSTIIITSYFVENFNYALLNKGLLQRVCVLTKNFNKNQIKEIMYFLSDSIADTKEIPEVPKELIDFFNNLENIQTTLVCSLTANKYLKKIFDEMIDEKIGKVNEEKEELLLSFFTRWHNIILKIATQITIMDHKQKIEQESIDEAIRIFDKHGDSIINLINELIKPEEETYLEAITDFISIQKRYSDGKTKMASEIRKNYYKLGINKIQKYIDVAVKRKLIKLETHPTLPNKFIYMLPNDELTKPKNPSWLKQKDPS
jgi:hypothetical protein